MSHGLPAGPYGRVGSCRRDSCDADSWARRWAILVLGGACAPPARRRRPRPPARRRGGTAAVRHARPLRPPRAGPGTGAAAARRPAARRGVRHGDRPRKRLRRARSHPDGHPLLRAAEIALGHARALAPRRMRWPYYLGQLYRTTGTSRAPSSSSSTPSTSTRPISRRSFASASCISTRPCGGRRAALRAGAGDRSGVRAGAVRHRAAPPWRGAKTARAIEYLERALAVGPAAWDIHYNLATAYRDAGRPDRAEEHLNQRGGDPPEPPIRSCRRTRPCCGARATTRPAASRRCRTGRAADAVEIFREGIAETPDDASLRPAARNRALRHRRRRRRGRAVRGGAAPGLHPGPGPCRPGNAGEHGRPAGRGHRAFQGSGPTRSRLPGGAARTGGCVPRRRPPGGRAGRAGPGGRDRTRVRRRLAGAGVAAGPARPLPGSERWP